MVESRATAGVVHPAASPDPDAGGRGAHGRRATAAALTAVWTVAALPWAERGVAVLAAWRAYGLVVFAGLFALLARRPHGHRGVRELVIFHKVALTIVFGDPAR